MENEEFVKLSPATKFLLGTVGTILSGLIISTWNTVTNSSLDIVRLQGRTTAIEGQMAELKDVDKEKIQDLNLRLTSVEARVIVLESSRSKRKKEADSE